MNAADRKGQREVERVARHRRTRMLEALRSVLGTEAGRLVFGERGYGILSRLGVLHSVFSPDAAVMAYNAGKQDAGLEITALIVNADETLYLRMDAEMRALAERDRREDEAAELSRKQARATEGDGVTE